MKSFSRINLCCFALICCSSGSLLAQTGYNSGINQASPQSALHVKGLGATSSTSTFQTENSSGQSSLFIQDDGKIGVGTKTPAYQLDLQGSSASAGLFNQFRLGNAFTATNNNGAQLLFGANRSTSGYTNVAGVSGIITDISQGAYKGALVFSTSNNGEPAERMRIDNVGNVTIGTSRTFYITPNYAGLDDIFAGALIQGSPNNNASEGLAMTTGSVYSGAKIGAMAYNGTNWKSVWETSNQANSDPYLLLMKNGGRVGVGVDNPTCVLDVAAPAAASGAESVFRFTVKDAGGGDYIKISNNSSTNGSFIPILESAVGNSNDVSLMLVGETSSTYDSGTNPLIQFDGRNTSNGYILNRPLFKWSNAGSSLMIMDAKGNLGVGTTPSANLHVLGSGVKTATYRSSYLVNSATTTTSNLVKYGLDIQSFGDWGSSANGLNIGLNVNVSGSALNYAANFQGVW